jgi:predicted RNA-binding Zn ribbon-like protein
MSRHTKLRNSVWKDGLLFVGNHLALDFLNTLPVQNGKPIELLPDFGALLRWFQAADLLSPHKASSLRKQWGESARAQRTVEAMRELRERLRKEVLDWKRGRAVHHAVINELNRLMTAHPMLIKLRVGGREYSKERWFESRQPEDLFAPLAQGATTLFADVDHHRVRKCDGCVLHFHDTSKKGTRRWCSMQLCGNRLKVAAYAARQRMRTHE